MLNWKINILNTVAMITLIFACTHASAQYSKAYSFDRRGITREVLENYLERSITMAFYLVPQNPEGKRVYPYHGDDMRMIKNTGAKFIGRAIYRWGGESLLNDPAFWSRAKGIIDTLHRFDPDIIFQGCLFEIVTDEVSQVRIPSWVFSAYGLPVADRAFSYHDMLNVDGKFVDHWRKSSSVPDISRQETQLWFYYLAAAYINLGCEAFHLGQVELIGMNDPNRDAWAALLLKIRQYAADHARRGWVLLDAHVPKGDMIKNGVSLLDFNSFPLRIKEIPERPYEGKLESGFLDALYNKSKGCVSPSGWTCKSLPYLVEFDNFGRNNAPNVADTTDHFVWGWDEISWFALQREDYRNEWLQYAYTWIKKNDPTGHLEMPGCRMLSCPNETFGSYRANNKSASCPVGYSQENVIKGLWSRAK